MQRSIPRAMRAFVVEAPGGPEQLVAKDLPVPDCPPGNVLIRVRALGLNRSEWFTRRGDSPTVKFPRVLGIECVGEVADPGDSTLKVGQRMAAMMGGMGRDFDGSYAEYVSVPAANVFAVETNLPWARFGALPEMLQTTHGSLYHALDITHKNSILIRGGTSSVGFAAIAIAHANGLTVTATTRTKQKSEFLINAGAENVIVDDGNLAERAQEIHPGGFDCVLELIGASTLLDSLRATRRGGTVCMTGILGGQWTLEQFYPMRDIPTAVKLTSYSGEASDIDQNELQTYIELVENNQLSLNLGPVFSFADLPAAHRLMDENAANGKIVVVVD